MDQDPPTDRQAAIRPPQSQIDRAIAESICSPCRSKRGVVIFRGETPVARGYNFKPRVAPCDGTAECKATCRAEAIHAEQAALLRAGLHAQGSDLLHVKTVDGVLVPSGGPSCVQCSKLIAVSGIVNVWLYHEDGWRRYDAEQFHHLSLAEDLLRALPPEPQVEHIYCDSCEEIRPLVRDFMPADANNAHAATDLICAECRNIVATLHHLGALPPEGVIPQKKDDDLTRQSASAKAANLGISAIPPETAPNADPDVLRVVPPFQHPGYVVRRAKPRPDPNLEREWLESGEYAALQRVETLREALRTYGHHHGRCALRNISKATWPECSCGLFAALGEGTSPIAEIPKPGSPQATNGATETSSSSAPRLPQERTENGVSLIAAERQRQIDRAGWTPEHDDGHDDAELAQAAVCYVWAARQVGILLTTERMPLDCVLSLDVMSRETMVRYGADIGSRDWRVPRWPWEPSHWKPSGDVSRNLAKAGALIAAEIDRRFRTADLRPRDERRRTDGSVAQPMPSDAVQHVDLRANPDTEGSQR